MNRRIALAAAALLTATPALAACGSSSPSSASSNAFGASVSAAPTYNASFPTVKLMIGGWDKQIYLPYTLAQKLGFYQKYGVNVVLSTEGSVSAEDALLAGDVQMSGAWYNHTIQLQDKGKSVEDVVQLSGAPGERIMCGTNSGVHSPADIKGKKMGVTDIGSGTDTLTQFIAAKAGIKRSDYKTIGVGAGAPAIAQLQRGNIDCMMTTQPTVGALESQGLAYSAIDLATVQGAQAAIGDQWPAAGVLAKTDWVNSNKATVQKVVDALVATMHWIHTHNATDIANALPQSFVQNPLVTKADYIKSLTQDYGQFLPDGLMPASGAQNVLKSLVLVKVATGNEDLSKTYTNDFATQAAKDGALN
ncbi:ABC transporter substrate-binding protein [Nocardioides baekrokdamisoli]|nr:ABC transporter substrate-binding protein [Nocardioides baekrokdamisoli]